MKATSGIVACLLTAIIAAPGRAQLNPFAPKPRNTPLAVPGAKDLTPEEIKRLDGERVEYELEEKHGPTLIFIASYVGYEGINYANRLARELREKHKFNAYVYRHQDKNDLLMATKQMAEFKKQFKDEFKVSPRIPRYKTPPVPHFAVMVGDFKSAENDRQYDKTLARLKKLKYESFSPEVGDELRWGNVSNGIAKGTLVGLRATNNPKRADREVKVDPAQMKLLKEMNEPEEFGIYKLRAAVTLCVASFRSASTLSDDKKIGVKSNTVQTAAHNAVILCDTMRKMGYEAYVFHGLTGSCVCIGGYAGASDPQLLADFQKYKAVKIGQFQLDPQIIPVPRHPDSGVQAN
jgi:hypothetical protein